MNSIFSIEMESKRHVRSISISDQAHDRVLFEGDLGSLLEVSIIECNALEMVGEYGVLRIEIDEDVLQGVLESPDRELSLSSEVGSYKNTKKERREKGMKCKKSIALLALVFTLVLIPTVSAKKAIKCTHDITLNVPDWQWEGTITFPNGETYEIIWHADTTPSFVGHPTEPGSLFPRHLEQFFEWWEIFDGEDGYAYGYDKGIFSSDTWMYVMNGWVEDATGTLAYLAGGRMHASGVAEIIDGVFYGEGINTFTAYAGS